MNDTSIFLQKTYKKLNESLAKYGCYFLSLCYVSQMMNASPAKNLETREDVLAFAKLAQSKGWLEADFTVLEPSALLKYLTGRAFKIVEDPAFGLYGKAHFLPINYPVDPIGAIQIACWRAKENVNNTHFSLVDRTGDSLFNTLGQYWLTDVAGRFFSVDKRVFVPVG